MCFVDGPHLQNMCNMDFIKLVTEASAPMSCIIDTRRTTQAAYADLLGKNKMTRFHNELCLFEDCTKHDLADIRYKEIFFQNHTERAKILRY